MNSATNNSLPNEGESPNVLPDDEASSIDDDDDDFLSDSD